MKESYVSYEQAVKLKELGFDWECDHYYDTSKLFKEARVFPQTFKMSDFWHNFNEDDQQNRHKQPFYPECSAPSLSLAQKWLREVKGIDVLIFNCACGYGWEISKSDPQSRGTTIALFDDNGEDESSGMWLSYESALSAGIDTALKILEEKL